MTEFALVFPGQGSQSVGMLAPLAAEFDCVAETFGEAGEALQTDLWATVRHGPSEALGRTEVTQPALLAAGVAVWRCWHRAGGPAPAWMAGHSLGEYTALVCAGALDFADGVQLVAERGRLMQAAVPEGEGSMAAVLGLDDEVISAICKEVEEDEVVAPANFNSPGQVVISGHRAAVERACHKAREAGAKRVLLLPVSVPSHCALMKPAGEALARRLLEIDLRTPDIPVLHNADVATHDTPEAIRSALVAQLSAPVRWTESMRYLAGRGVDAMAECGPGKVLSGLQKRIDRSVPAVALESPRELVTTANEWSRQA